MYAIVEFFNNDQSTSISLVHCDWFLGSDQTRVLCPNANWYKVAEKWSPKISTLKWKAHRCRVLKRNIGNLNA